MAELVVALDPADEANFNGLYDGYHFNPLGMCCPVRSCPVTVLLPSHGLYLKHYRVWHLPTLLKWSCDTCERVFGSKQNKRAHRFCYGRNATFFLFHIPNLQYINPDDVKVPLPMDRSVNPIGICSSQLLQHRREQGIRDNRNLVSFAALVSRGLRLCLTSSSRSVKILLLFV